MPTQIISCWQKMNHQLAVICMMVWDTPFYAQSEADLMINSQHWVRRRGARVQEIQKPLVKSPCTVRGCGELETNPGKAKNNQQGSNAQKWQSQIGAFRMTRYIQYFPSHQYDQTCQSTGPFSLIAPRRGCEASQRRWDEHDKSLDKDTQSANGLPCWEERQESVINTSRRINTRSPQKRLQDNLVAEDPKVARCPLLSFAFARG